MEDKRNTEILTIDQAETDRICDDSNIYNLTAFMREFSTPSHKNRKTIVSKSYVRD